MTGIEPAKWFDVIIYELDNTQPLGSHRQNLVEDTGVEPVTQACKASVFPTILIPQILVCVIGFEPTTSSFQN